MSNIKLIFQNDYDTATLIHSHSTAVELGIENTQKMDNSAIMRTLAIVQHITGTMPSQAVAGGFAISHHNLLITAVITLTLKLNSAVVYSGTIDVSAQLLALGEWSAGVDGYGSIFGDDLPQIAPLWFDAVIYDEFIIDINDVDNTTGFIDIGRIFLGPVFSPKFNFSYGANLTYLDDVEHFRTEAGGLYSVGNSLYRQLSINLDFLDESDRNIMERSIIRNNRTRDLLVSGYPDVGGERELKHTMVAKRGTVASFEHSFFNNNKNSLVLEES